MKIIKEIQDFNEASESDSLEQHNAKVVELLSKVDTAIPLLTLLLSLKPLIIALLKFAKVFTNKKADEKIDRFIELLELF